MKKIAEVLIALYTVGVSAQTSEIINFGQVGQTMLSGDAIIDDEGKHLILMGTVTGIIISRHNATYVPLWTKQLDFQCSGDNGKVIQHSSGNYLVITTQSGATPNGRILMISKSGTILWHKELNATIYCLNEIDQGYVAFSTGYITHSAITVLDPDGNFVWSKQIQPPGTENLITYELIKTNDSHLLAVSNRTGSSNYALHLAKMDYDGNLVWEQNYLTPLGDIYYDGVHGTDGNFYLAGYAMQGLVYNDTELSIAKFDGTGNYVDHRYYGYDNFDQGNDIIEDGNGDFIVIGYSKPIPSCGGNLTIFKIDTALDTIYTRHYGTSAGNGSFFWNIHKDDDVFYMFGCGSLWSTVGTGDGHLIKTDTNFDLPCEPYLQSTTITDPAAYTSTASIANHSAVVLTLTDKTGETPISLLTTDACTGAPISVHENKDSELKIYPVPASNSLNVIWSGTDVATAGILDITGKTVVFCQLAPGENSIDVSSLKKGAYILNVTSSEFNTTRKIVVE